MTKVSLINSKDNGKKAVKDGYYYEIYKIKKTVALLIPNAKQDLHG